MYPCTEGYKDGDEDGVNDEYYEELNPVEDYENDVSDEYPEYLNTFQDYEADVSDE